MNCRAVLDAFHPGLDSRPGVERLDARPRVTPDPRVHVDVRERVRAAAGASKVVAVLEADLKHAVESLRLLQVAWKENTCELEKTKHRQQKGLTVDRIRDLLWCIPAEVVRLALHGTHTSVSEEDPLEELGVVIRARRRIEAKFVLLVIVLAEIQEDRGTLEHLETPTLAVDKGRDTAVRVDVNEPGLLLLVRGDVDVRLSARNCSALTGGGNDGVPHGVGAHHSLVVEAIGGPELLEEDVRLPTVRGRAGIQVQGHDVSACGGGGSEGACDCVQAGL
jgi:hypothetical protein